MRRTIEAMKLMRKLPENHEYLLTIRQGASFETFALISA